MRWTKNLQPCLTRNKPGTKIDRDALCEDVETYPDHFLHERAKRFGVTAAGIRHALRRLGVTYKKKPFSPQSLSRGTKAKTDRLDARALATYGQERHKELALYQIPDTTEADLKALVERRSDLTKILVQEKAQSPAQSDPVQLPQNHPVPRNRDLRPFPRNPKPH